MRKSNLGLTAVIMAGVLLLQPIRAVAQSDQTPASDSRAPLASRGLTNFRPIAVGLGAIAGVVLFNVAFLGAEALPGGLAYGAGATVPAEMSVAMSRVYATTAAVIGDWVGYYSVGR